jgi:predicted secreted Zn-dependent protease
MLQRLLCAFVLSLAGAVPAGAATLSKSYSYFTIHGKTLDEIERQLGTRGPKLDATGQRHPGLTRMEFRTHVDFRRRSTSCEVAGARVALTVKVILPRWSDRGADGEVKLVWDALSSDIRRHEEEHVKIAQAYAQDLERQLRAIGPQRNCPAVEAKVAQVRDKVLKKHDSAQDRFDEKESRTFQSRLSRLFEDRLEKAASRR